jgi:hypothetical protein
MKSLSERVIVTVRVPELDRRKIAVAAAQSNMTVNEWAHGVLLREAERINEMWAKFEMERMKKEHDNHGPGSASR